MKTRRKGPAPFEKKLALTLLGVLALIMVMALVPAQAEGIKSGENLLARFDPLPRGARDLLSQKDTLFLTDNDRLYALTGAGEALSSPLVDLLGKPESDSYLDPVLVPGEDGAALLDKRSGKLLMLRVQGGSILPSSAHQLDWSDYLIQQEGYTQVNPPLAFALSKGTLYALEAPGTPLVRFDLTSGEKQTQENSPPVFRLVPEHQGRLLIITGDTKGPLSLARYAPESGSTEILFTLPKTDQPLGLIAYDPQTGTLYYALGDTVYAFLGTGEGQPVCLLPFDDTYMGQQPFAPLPGGQLAVLTREAVFAQSADPGEFSNRVTLRLRLAAMNTSGINEAAARLPGISLKTVEQGLSALELAQLMVAGDPDTDLFWVSLDQAGFQSLMKKGYAVNLSQSPALLADFQALSPALRQAVGQAGQPFALPMTVTGHVLLGEKEILKDATGEIGLKTLSDFLTFCETWPGQMAQDHPDMIPFGESEMRHAFFRLAFNTYVQDQLARGEEVRLDTPQLRELMDRVSKLPFLALGEERVNEDYLAPVVFDNEWLMFLRLLSGDGRDSHDYFPFLLSMKEGEEGALPLSVSAVFVNIHSRHPKEALAFLEALLQSRQPDSHIMMSEQANEPVINPWYEQELAQQEARIQEFRDRLKDAPQQEQAELTAQVQRMEGYLQTMREENRYLISPGQIAAFRQLSKNAYVRQYSGQALGIKAALDLLPQYVMEQISLDQFLQDAQSRLDLVRLEGE